MESQLQLIRRVLNQLEVENNKRNRIYASQIQIWIPACALLSILTITINSIFGLSWLMLGWKENSIGYKYVFQENIQTRTFRGSNRARNQSLKINCTISRFSCDNLCFWVPIQLLGVQNSWEGFLSLLYKLKTSHFNETSEILLSSILNKIQ